MKILNLIPVDPIDQLPFFQTWLGILLIIELVLIGVFVMAIIVTIIIKRRKRRKRNE